MNKSCGSKHLLKFLILIKLTDTDIAHIFFSVYKVLILNDKIKKQGQWVKNMYTIQNINALMNKRQGIKQNFFYKIVLIITIQLILFCINN